MTLQHIVKAVARLTPNANRIGLDAILQHVAREAETARKANLNAIKRANGRAVLGSAHDDDTTLVVAVSHLHELRDELERFLTDVAGA